MKKEAKTMWILMALLILLMVVLLFVKSWNHYQEEKEAEEAEAEVITVYEAEALAEMSYEDSEGQSQSFIKTDDTWQYAADAEASLDDDVMNQMEAAFTNIEAEKMIEEPDELSDYGMDEPQYRLTLMDATGGETVLLIGDMTGESYYLMAEDGDVVYVVGADLVNEMLWDTADFIIEDSAEVEE